MNPYIGHMSQLYGIEEHRLVGGRGDGMRLIEVHNGRGLDMTVSADRACDIARLHYKGINVGYFSPCGYVGPQYYDPAGEGFLKSFTAGFLTTCGLQAVGTPCTDAGEVLPLHGSIANTPAEQVAWYEEDGRLVIDARINDSGIFSRKLTLHRKLLVDLADNGFEISDAISNEGDQVEPLEILYHMNMGYPLLDEDSEVDIPSDTVTARNAHAQTGIEACRRMERPSAGYEEMCFYHAFSEKGAASIYQPKHNMGLRMTFSPEQLDCFTEWKMMGIRDYVLGLECGNCYPDGRDVMRSKGMLKYIRPGQTVNYRIRIDLFEND